VTVLTAPLHSPQQDCIVVFKEMGQEGFQVVEFIVLSGEIAL
jgi:hypothetical protein